MEAGEWLSRVTALQAGAGEFYASTMGRDVKLDRVSINTIRKKVYFVYTLDGHCAKKAVLHLFGLHFKKRKKKTFNPIISLDLLALEKRSRMFNPC